MATALAALGGTISAVVWFKTVKKSNEADLLALKVLIAFLTLITTKVRTDISNTGKREGLDKIQDTLLVVWQNNRGNY